MDAQRVEAPPPVQYTCVLEAFLDVRGAQCKLVSSVGVEPGIYRCWTEVDRDFDVPRISVVTERAWWRYIFGKVEPSQVWVWPATHVFISG